MFHLNAKNGYTYIFAIGVILVASYYGNQIKQAFEPRKSDEYELVKKYLLNDSPLYGYNKPKIWIHSKYEVNARKWKDFQSRNTTDLNQPYIHLTIKTIIDHCGDDFHICLIDDETFSKLIPTWDIDMTAVAEPLKSHLREVGMMELVYYYGGMVVPNSFLCLKNLKEMYQTGISGNRPFVCEKLNRSVDLFQSKSTPTFVPGVDFFGAAKNDESLREFLNYLKKKTQNLHFTNEFDFLGEISTFILSQVASQNQFNVIGGELIGLKTALKRKPILLEELMEENFLDLDERAYGIYIPREEILTRHKYQWFAVLSSEELLNTNMVITKYLISALADPVDSYKNRVGEIRSAISI